MRIEEDSGISLWDIYTKIPEDEIGLMFSPKGKVYDVTVCRSNPYYNPPDISKPSPEYEKAKEQALQTLNELRLQAADGEEVQKELLAALENLFHIQPFSSIEHLQKMSELLQKNAELCDFIFKMQMALQNGDIVPIIGGGCIIYANE